MVLLLLLLLPLLRVSVRSLTDTEAASGDSWDTHQTLLDKGTKLGTRIFNNIQFAKKMYSFKALVCEVELLGQSRG